MDWDIKDVEISVYSSLPEGGPDGNGIMATATLEEIGGVGAIRAHSAVKIPHLTIFVMLIIFIHVLEAIFNKPLTQSKTKLFQIIKPSLIQQFMVHEELFQWRLLVATQRF